MYSVHNIPHAGCTVLMIADSQSSMYPSTRYPKQPSPCICYRQLQYFITTTSTTTHLRLADIPNRRGAHVPITSASCVFGIAAGNARNLRRVCVACSYAYANEMSLNSLNAVPKKERPNGMFGPLSRVGRAGESEVSGGKNPSGTTRHECCECPMGKDVDVDTYQSRLGIPQSQEGSTRCPWAREGRQA